MSLDKLERKILRLTVRKEILRVKSDKYWKYHDLPLKKRNEYQRKFHEYYAQYREVRAELQRAIRVWVKRKREEEE